MMWNRRSTIATLLVGAILATSGIQAHAAPSPVRYACTERPDLIVERDRSSAQVRVANQTYDLQRKRSSIGAKYGSASAALIIDGASAIFVADNRLDLGNCVKAVPLAAAR